MPQEQEEVLEVLAALVVLHRADLNITTNV